MLYIIGQIIGVAAMIESFFIYQVKERKKMIVLKLVDDLLWVAHFVMIGGYAAATTTGIAIFREIVFYCKADKKWANTLLWPIGFSVVFAACAIPSFQNLWGVLPSVASIASTWAFWLNNSKVTKIMQLPTAGCMLAYDIVKTSYSGSLTQIVTLVSVVVFFLRDAKNKIARQNSDNQSKTVDF